MNTSSLWNRPANGSRVIAAGQSPGLSVGALVIIVALTIMLMLGASFANAAFAEKAYAGGESTALTAGKLDKQSAKKAKKFAPKISKKTLSMVYGKSSKLKVKGSKGKKVTWKSSNPEVIAVKPAGTAAAKLSVRKAGKATIIAKVGSKKLKCKVTAVGKLSATELTLSSFETEKLTLQGATVKSWESSEDLYVEVDKNGVVTPGGFEDEAQVICTDTLGNKYYCNVATTLPNISCSMDESLYQDLSDTRYYYKSFTFKNRSGKTIRLASELMVYYPFGINSDTKEVMLGLHGSDISNTLDDWPMTVDSGYYIEFESFVGTSRYLIYDDGMFQMTITVGGKEYGCFFETDGTLSSCIPD